MPKFKLLQGKHAISCHPLVQAREGDVFESDRDLVEAFGAERFERVSEEVSVDVAPAPEVPLAHIPDVKPRPVEPVAPPAPEAPVKEKKK